MAAYLVVEGTPRDRKALDLYGTQAIALMKEFGGEVIKFGLWQLLVGEQGHANGMIVRFEDGNAALAWYNSPAYQALVELRETALDCRIRLVG
jgi:uncharacterized protein (DUF1330 family)